MVENGCGQLCFYCYETENQSAQFRWLLIVGDRSLAAPPQRAERFDLPTRRGGRRHGAT